LKSKQCLGSQNSAFVTRLPSFYDIHPSRENRLLLLQTHNRSQISHGVQCDQHGV
jgi:hypothetical protein